VAKPVLLVYANCQGESLAELFVLHPAVAADYTVRYHPNYTGLAVPEPDIRAAHLCLYQWLDPARWGRLSSDDLLAALPRGCRSLCLPNLLFKGYWPFWAHRPGFDYPDILLDKLLAMGLSDREILHLYLYADVSRFHDLPRIFAASLAQERDKEKRWDIRVVDLIEARFRSEWLFATHNHPRKTLLLYVARQALDLLSLPPLPDAVAADFPEPFAEFELPIHPQVAALRKLAFLPENPTFAVYGTRLNLTGYVACYLDCRRRNVGDFIGYLRLAAEAKEKGGMREHPA
jgi:hypothetical protein